MPNSYVHNPELNLTGQCMNDWQTGASNVLLKVLIRHVFGFQPGFDGLRVAPARWMPFASFQFDAVAHGRPVRISYTRQPVRLRQFRLAGQPFARTEHDRRLDTATVLMPYDALSDTAENVIEVIDPAAG